MVPRWLAAVLLVVLLADGCGGTGSPGAAMSTTSTPTASATSAVSGTPPATPTPRKGLPPSYPQAEVPLVDGRVQMGDSGTPGGSGGWDAYVIRDGSAADCLAAAGAALLGRGFTEQVVMTNGGLHQAQYTSPRYAVLVSAEANGKRGCSLKYTVGELGG